MGFGAFRIPKNNDKYYWTRHSIGKMMQYGLSEQRIKRIIRSYERIEYGVAKDTVAVMQPKSFKFQKDGTKKWTQELWVMYQKPVKNSKCKIKSCSQEEKISNNFSKFDFGNFGGRQIKIISAWCYPGVSPKNNPIPKEIIEELGDVI